MFTYYNGTANIEDFGCGIITVPAANNISGLPNTLYGGSATLIIRSLYGSTMSTIIVDIENNSGIFARRGASNEWVKIV